MRHTFIISTGKMVREGYMRQGNNVRIAFRWGLIMQESIRMRSYNNLLKMIHQVVMINTNDLTTLQKKSQNGILLLQSNIVLKICFLLYCSLIVEIHLVFRRPLNIRKVIDA